MAVVDNESGELAAAVKRSGESTRYACIGGTFTFPEHRRQGLATGLVQFLVSALLRERPGVHLIVDDDNMAAIELYRKLAFEEVGACYMAYLG